MTFPRTLSRGILGLGLVGAAIGFASWAIVSLHALIRRTEQTLTQTDQALQHHQHALQELTTRQDTLVGAYRTVTDQVGTETRQLQQFSTQHTQTARELDALTTKRQAFEQTLNAGTRGVETLRHDVATLTNQSTSLQRDIAHLKETLTQLTKQPQVSPADLDQLKARLANDEQQQATIQASLKERVLELSQAVDQLLSERLAPERTPHQPLATTLSQHPRTPLPPASVSAAPARAEPRAAGGPARAERQPINQSDPFLREQEGLDGQQASAPPKPLGQGVVVRSFSATEEPSEEPSREPFTPDESSPPPPTSPVALETDGGQADLHRELGEAYLALANYPKAAEELTTSLQFRDDPKVHAKLALLYGRLLHNPSLASLHEARSTPEDLMTTATPSTAQAHGLPRDSWPLVRKWLFQ